VAIVKTLTGGAILPLKENAALKYLLVATRVISARPDHLVIARVTAIVLIMPPPAHGCFSKSGAG
jgi:hypothetical protein